MAELDTKFAKFESAAANNGVSDEHHTEASLIKTENGLGFSHSGFIKTESVDFTELTHVTHLHPDQMKTETADGNCIKAEQISDSQNTICVDIKSEEVKLESSRVSVSDHWAEDSLPKSEKPRKTQAQTGASHLKCSYITKSPKAVRPCFFRCEKKIQLFSLPKDSATRNQWVAFLFSGSEQPLSKGTLAVCARHFTEDSFVNKGQFDAGYASQLLLKPGAVPSIKSSEPQASTSRQTPTASNRQRDPRVSVATQTTRNVVSVSTQVSRTSSQRSVGTQLAYETLKPHARSKGIQATVRCVSVGTETDSCLQSSSTPIKTSVAVVGVRPAKRPRLDFQAEEEEESSSSSSSGESASEIQERLDPTYEPEESLSETSQMSELESARHQNEPKFIVFESCLQELFQTCPVCKRDCNVQKRKLGTYVAFNQQCPNCQFSRKWQSQPIRGSTPVGNLQMSAGIYFTGVSFVQVQNICKAINLQIFKYDTFRKHARMFLEPAIIHKWKRDQDTILQDLKQKGKISLGGDMRSDSAGHSAKFGSYTLMNLEDNKIIDVQLVLSNEVGGSVHMEQEGLRRALNLLQSNQIDLDYMVTDRYNQVQKFLKDQNITQYYDVRLLEKGLSKKLANLAKNKKCQVVSKWLPAIKKHIYWTATSSKTGPERVAKWKSLRNHIQDVHTHEDPLFPKCAHPDKVSQDPSKWFQPGSLALHKVEKLLMNKRILCDVEKLNHNCKTSSFEAFHSVILRFAPKNVVFPFIGMLCRLYLAALHFNENAEREHARTAEGRPTSKRTFAESREGKATAKPAPTFTYVQDLMTLVSEEVFEDPTLHIEELKRIAIPEDLSAQPEGPAVEEVNAGHASRYSPGVAGTQHTVLKDLEMAGVSTHHGMTTLKRRHKWPVPADTTLVND